MDTITDSIVAALEVGIEKGVAQEYNALQEALKRKFGSDSKLVEAVKTLENEPDFKPNQEALAGRVKQVNADKDPELTQLARALLDAIARQTPQSEKGVGKYNIQVQEGQVGVIGDGAHIEGGMHFNRSTEHVDFSGATISGSNVNIKSRLQNVTQTIGALPNADPTTKAELEKLIKELNDALQKVPTNKSEDAAAVAESAQILVDNANKEKPNKTMIQITGEGLKKAAQNIADVMPVVLTIATQIVATIARLVP